MNKLSVIIVSYNSGKFIKKCVNSVLKNLPDDGEIIVIDNASTDKTLEILSKCKVIESKINLGFSKGNNEAVKEAKGEYLFFLNPDTEIPSQAGDDKNFFSELINFYEQNPDAGIVGPKLVMENGRVQPSVRKLPSVWGAFQEYILGIKNSYEQYVPEGFKPVEVEMVYGAAMLIKKDLFEKLRGFDEKFFLYYEDADLCKRVRNLGKKIYYFPKVSIKHLVGATKSDLDRSKINWQSAEKYHGLIGATLLRLIFLVPRLRRHF